MSVGQTIDYDALAQDAMRGLVRTVLTQITKTGLPGAHHFYISFETDVAGVSLSKRLKEKYPREMTIVLQHRFWDLAVTEDRFEVKLAFDGIPERLVVPFAAIKVFFDPSVPYGLQFEEPSFGADAGVAGALDEQDATRRSRAGAVKKPRSPRRSRAGRNGQGAGDTTAQTATTAANTSTSVHSISNADGEKKQKRREAEADATTASNDSAAETETETAGAQILSLDQFRKK